MTRALCRALLFAGLRALLSAGLFALVVVLFSLAFGLAVRELVKR